MAQESVRVYTLTELGLRAFYTPAEPNATQEETDLTYYSHSHPYYELHLILDGSVVMQAGQQQYRLDKHSFCLISPQTSHAPKSSILGVSRLCIGLSVSDPDCSAAAFLLKRTKDASACTGPAEQMLQTLTQLTAEEDTVRFSAEMTAQLLSVLVLQMLRTMEASQGNSAGVHRDLNDLRTVRIDRFLNNSFHLQGAQQLLAAELGLSRRQLDRVLQKLYGCSFRDKLLQVRAEAACDLLRGDMTVARIAQRVGYSSSANFTAFFRNYMGMTPSQYRGKCR